MSTILPAGIAEIRTEEQALISQMSDRELWEHVANELLEQKHTLEEVLRELSRLNVRSAMAIEESREAKVATRELVSLLADRLGGGKS